GGAAPPAAASFRSSSRLSFRSTRSRSSSPPLVAGRTDDPHDLGGFPADIRHAVRRRAAVVDAVAVPELVDVTAELELPPSRQDDEQLLRVPVRVRLRPCRAAWVELSGEHLEMLERPRRQQELASEDSERERRTLVAAQHPRPGRTARLEQVRDRDAERV